MADETRKTHPGRPSLPPTETATPRLRPAQTEGRSRRSSPPTMTPPRQGIPQPAPSPPHLIPLSSRRPHARLARKRTSSSSHVPPVPRRRTPTDHSKPRPARRGRDGIRAIPRFPRYAAVRAGRDGIRLRSPACGLEEWRLRRRG